MHVRSSALIATTLFVLVLIAIGGLLFLLRQGFGGQVGFGDRVGGLSLPLYCASAPSAIRMAQASGWTLTAAPRLGVICSDNGISIGQADYRNSPIISQYIGIILTKRWARASRKDLNNRRKRANDWRKGGEKREETI